MRRTIRCCSPGLLLAGLAAAACLAQPADVDPKAAAVLDGLQRRVELADDLLVAGVTLLAGHPQTPAGEVKPLTCYYATSYYARTTKDQVEESSWRMSPSGPNQWHSSLAFVWQDATKRQALRLDPDGLAPAAQLSVTPPVADSRTFLYDLGIALASRQPLASVLQGPLRVEADRTLRGHACLVLTGANGELWVAPEYEYAPLRCIVRTSQNGRELAFVDDWWGYRLNGALYTPEYGLARRLSGATIDSGILRRFTETLAGATPVAEHTPAAMHVPLMAGAEVIPLTRVLGEPARMLGINPRSVLAAAAEDLAPWSLSLRELFDDTAWRLPKEIVR